MQERMEGNEIKIPREDEENLPPLPSVPFLGAIVKIAITATAVEER